jgi:hypothetical protein
MAGVPLAVHWRMPRVPLNRGPMSAGCEVNIGCCSMMLWAARASVRMMRS